MEADIKHCACSEPPGSDPILILNTENCTLRYGDGRELRCSRRRTAFNALVELASNCPDWVDSVSLYRSVRSAVGSWEPGIDDGVERARATKYLTSCIGRARGLLREAGAPVRICHRRTAGNQAGYRWASEQVRVLIVRHSLTPHEAWPLAEAKRLLDEGSHQSAIDLIENEVLGCPDGGAVTGLWSEVARTRGAMYCIMAYWRLPGPLSADERELLASLLRICRRGLLMPEERERFDREYARWEAARDPTERAG